MKIIYESANKLLRRRELITQINETSSPTFSQTKTMLAVNLKVPEEQVVIKSIRSKFGRHTFEVDAFVYESIADKERIEQKPKQKKAKTEASK